MFNTQSVSITPEILALISQIDEFKGVWRNLGTLTPDRWMSLKKLATIESVASSTRIEGSKLTNAEVATLLNNLQTQNFATRDEQEVAGYAQVMALIFESWADIPLTENHIKQLHRDLLIYSEKEAHHRGHYKTIANSVGAFNEKGVQVAVVFETATPFDTPRLMQELLAWLAKTREQQSLHPLLIVAIFVVTFLAIHPFEDGNGRLSRILTTLLLLQLGYRFIPYSSLESVIEQNKQGYYVALRNTQSTLWTEKPNWQPWLQYFLSAMRSVVKHLSAKMDDEKIMLSALPPLSANLLALTSNHAHLTLASAQAATAANRATIKAHLAKLVKAGHLQQHGVGRGTWYSR